MSKEKRTYADRAEYIKQAVAKRRKKLRRLALATKGSCCIICGYNKCPEALEFHHYGKKNQFGLSAQGITRSWEKTQKEIQKCALLCANCHREVHSGITQLPKVTSE